jgi:hypothetical protein
LLAPCRNAVSGKKVRYVADDFDLDLTYLAPRIIVHGFPGMKLTINKYFKIIFYYILSYWN